MPEPHKHCSCWYDGHRCCSCGERKLFPTLGTLYQEPVREKAPAISKMLDSLAVQMSGSPRMEGKCATCGGEAKEFDDELSKKEYQISFMCQNCQDSVFSPDARRASRRSEKDG